MRKLITFSARPFSVAPIRVLDNFDINHYLDEIKNIPDNILDEINRSVENETVLLVVKPLECECLASLKMKNIRDKEDDVYIEIIDKSLGIEGMSRVLPRVMGWYTLKVGGNRFIIDTKSNSREVCAAAMVAGFKETGELGMLEISRP